MIFFLLQIFVLKSLLYKYGTPNLNSINLTKVQTDRSQPINIISEFNLYNWCHAESSPKAIGVFWEVMNFACFPSDEILNVGLNDLKDFFLCETNTRQEKQENKKT